ncbi:MAG: sugar transferase [Paludibacteraceae bacterium]|nr:sugar transferase [Paludibacteraceae bacterium]
MWKRILCDCFLWAAAVVICVLWRLIVAKAAIGSYVLLFVVLACIWIVLGWLTRKYRSYKDTWFWQELASMLLTTGCMMALVQWVLPLVPFSFSQTVVAWTIGLVAIFDFIVILVTHYWKYAQNMTVPLINIEQRENAVVSRQEKTRTPNVIETIHQAVLSLTTEEDYLMLLKEAHLDSNLTKAIANTDSFSFLQVGEYQYSTLVDLTLLNKVRGINKRFCIVNQKLPDNGVYVCCYRPQEYVKQQILSRYPKGINYVAYTFWFLNRRVIPRLLLTSRLYYDVTKGNRRVLSKTEVLGRLYYCGFVVDKIVPMGHIEYVFAHRNSQPYPQEHIKLYGPFVKLPRVCKDHQLITFYKFRTMHPYSEYIQKYVFDQRGGMNISDKSDADFRITSWGRLMRKYWLDELPMLVNLLKGDVKLVGVRPLSRAMFETYPVELQEKRTRCKPGLIPPFYIDHPQTFDELFASEDKYLDEYFAHPFYTDCKYFFLTVHSILFKRMHSA